MFGSIKELFVSLDSIAPQSGTLSGCMLVRNQGREERKMELRALPQQRWEPSWIWDSAESSLHR